MLCARPSREWLVPGKWAVSTELHCLPVPGFLLSPLVGWTLSLQLQQLDYCSEAALPHLSGSLLSFLRI